MPVTFSAVTPDDEAPHVVPLPHRRPLREIVAWAAANGEGHCRISNAVNGPGACITEMRFTDANTAFWFKMRFG